MSGTFVGCYIITPSIQHLIMPANSYQDGYLWEKGIATTYAATMCSMWELYHSVGILVIVSLS